MKHYSVLTRADESKFEKYIVNQNDTGDVFYFL